ncbi:MAG: hypothetical protein DI582_09785 [Azospirillum brasilense]|nr:MAG: hypothetical protein DI582_09785 [Azospirillum brasilense]
MKNTIDAFVTHFVKELEEENAAIFAGAGLSMSSGFVSWRDLLKPMADELKLDIGKEHDLVALAQYHENAKGNRSDLNRVLIEQFTQDHEANENHYILARLPIRTYWTTNYDTLIETTLQKTSKIPDIKYEIAHLKNTRPKRDAVVYKMHGDIQNPDGAVLTKDDYEHYPTTHSLFVTALQGDLIAKTFLFLGFSFTDPNLDYVLSRVRIRLKGSSRNHYCIMKQCMREDFQIEEEFHYAELKQQLAINDLKRFSVQTILVPTYADITALLRRIEARFKQKTVLISGSAAEYGQWPEDEAEAFIRTLSARLTGGGFKVLTGFGLGVGSHVITGTLESIYAKGGRLHDQLILRPFPQGKEAEKQREAYRQDMIAHAGVALFMFGNKIDPNDAEKKNIVLADGMRREFEIAKEKGLKLIPIGITGYVAAELWQEINKDLDSYYPGASDAFKEAFAALNDEKTTLPQCTDIILRMLGMLKQE